MSQVRKLYSKKLPRYFFSQVRKSRYFSILFFYYFTYLRILEALILLDLNHMQSLTSIYAYGIIKKDKDYEGQRCVIFDGVTTWKDKERTKINKGVHNKK